MSDRERLVEVMARALYESNKFVKPWDHKDTVRLWHRIMRRYAKAGIAAAERAGFEIRKKDEKAMKKIEEAARELFPLGTYASVNNRNGFILGARYVLNAMKGKRAADVGEDSCDSVRRSDVVEILEAVRKEIEGE